MSSIWQYTAEVLKFNDHCSSLKHGFTSACYACHLSVIKILFSNMSIGPLQSFVPRVGDIFKFPHYTRLRILKSDFLYEHCITRFLVRIMCLLNLQWFGFKIPTSLNNIDFFFNWETSMTKFCHRYLSLRCSQDGKVRKSINRKSIRKHWKANENSLK